CWFCRPTQPLPGGGWPFLLLRHPDSRIYTIIPDTTRSILLRGDSFLLLCYTSHSRWYTSLPCVVCRFAAACHQQAVFSCLSRHQRIKLFTSHILLVLQET